MSVIIDNNNNNNNNNVFTSTSGFKIFLGKYNSLYADDLDRESVYAYDRESHLKWEFVLEFHLIVSKSNWRCPSGETWSYKQNIFKFYY